MKVKPFFIAVLSTSLLTVAACKKEDKKPKTTAEKVQGKWQVDNFTTHYHIDDQDTTEAYTGTSADYFDFRPDGKLYYSLEGEVDSVNYAFQSDTKLLFEGGVFDIQTLTDKQLKLYNKDTDPSTPSDFAETTINLKK